MTYSLKPLSVNVAFFLFLLLLNVRKTSSGKLERRGQRSYGCGVFFWAAGWVWAKERMQRGEEGERVVVSVVFVVVV